MRFSKYHALGNDYLVLEPDQAPDELTPSLVRLLCDRRHGAGADGLLFGPLPAETAQFGLRIFNPDGSEAEKSGNGLRIFARYLWDHGHVQAEFFDIATAGGVAMAQVSSSGTTITVDMGRVSFDSRSIPVAGPPREVLNETIMAGGIALRFCAVAVGNPHCVILRDAASAEEARRLGPLIERDPRFPNRTNVQFVQVVDHSHLRVEIWERGAGYTLASGSSSCAAAAAMHRLGLCDSQLTVSMPGGAVQVAIAPDWSVTLTGPVTRVYEGQLFEEALQQALPKATKVDSDLLKTPQPPANSDLSIRWATPADAQAIAEIHVLAWQAAYRGLLPDSLLDNLSIEERQARWEPRLAEPVRRTLACEHAGQVVGWATLGPHRDDDVDPQRVGEIYGIYLHPAVWRRGYGAALMARALVELRAQGFVEATLWVLRGNWRAIEFYKAQGFWPDGAAKVDVRPDGVEFDEVRYRRVLV